MSLASNRWFRAERHRGDIDQLFDLYWGGKERCITTLTLKIMGVNLAAVIALIFGVVYLSQYHNTLIEAKLEHFETEIMIVTAAMADGALEGVLEEEAYDKESAQDIRLSNVDAARISGRFGPAPPPSLHTVKCFHASWAPHYQVFFVKCRSSVTGRV